MSNVTDGTWDSLPVKLDDNILQTLRELEFTHMTPVQVGALVVTPTRELALQISEVVETFLKRFPQFTQILLIGGTNPIEDVEKFKAQGLNTILSYLPKQRRTGLFSATQTQEVEKLVERVSEILFASLLRKKVCRPEDKFNNLVAFLRQHKHEKNLVFFSTCACVEYYSRALETLIKKVEVQCIHGKMKINVIKYLPTFCFCHRCGRTARIGNQGNALVFLLPMEESYVNFLSINQKCPLQKMAPVNDVVDVLPKIKALLWQIVRSETEDDGRQRNQSKTCPDKKGFVRHQAWSKQKNKKERRKNRAAKRKHDEGSDVDEEELNELLSDTRLLKKLKKKQITEEDFEKQITGGSRSKSQKTQSSGSSCEDD
ncbi:hypothetical protein WMY93_020815 [Mugilogobius chulae]|uniref:ATP-dependent RNA helicase n=1 Tax=Mugilogobius chulae TaxID=88201 RepID=A0AAW0NA31_9GOBI